MLRKIMKRAWEIAKEAVVKFGGKVKQYISEAMKMAWSESRKAVKVVYTIKQWFVEKNYDNFETKHLTAVNMFGTTFRMDDILKETEKAFFVNMPLFTKTTGAESKYTKKVWIPKSVCIAEEI